ncbi:hypothetical protein CDAR_275851 [Caerostris darwini]|uniref:TIL domain-containing protein n=2 Tax=Caerostris TaxID=172845 RepID=A0AAV4RRS2_9ARAC|nr:hypothetical protein CDAR_275851 [Caerostris darwini]GIY78174.1 hypothetical protein CEXT_490211 [Caerostris extrusa]
MRGLILFLCVALVCVTFAAAQLPKCSANKHFGSGGECPESCYTVKHPEPRLCGKMARIGCVCDKGFVLLKDKDYSSDCVKPEDCP